MNFVEKNLTMISTPDTICIIQHVDALVIKICRTAGMKMHDNVGFGLKQRIHA